MKQCPNCATALEDDAMFCLNCGTAVPADAPVAPAAPVAEAVYEEAPIGQVESYPTPMVDSDVPQAPAKKSLSKKQIGIIAIAAVALAAIIFVIIGFSTNWFRPPLSKVEDAIEKTLEANSFTIKADAEIPGQGDVSLEGKLVLDRENKNLSILADITMGNGYITFLAADGKVYTVQNMGDAKEASIEDIPSDAFEQIFNALDTAKEEELDDETLEKLIKSAGLKVEVEEVKAFIDSIEKDCFENKAWLEEFLGFEKKDGKYKFDFDVDDVIKDLVERAYEAEIITKSMKKQLSIQTNAKCEMEIVLDKGYIAEFEATVEIGGQEVSISVKLSDVNATVINDKDISETVEEVDEFIAEYYANCAQCGEQDQKSSMREVKSKYYCYDCYYDMDYCDICGDFVKEDTLSYINYDYRCEDCAAEYKKDNYVDCTGCKENMDKNNMRIANEQYYCSSCYYDRDYCDICEAFVLDDELTYKNGDYHCTSCYETYKADHTCDLCNEVVGSNYICSKHSQHGVCDGCGDERTLYYYNVQTKQHLCIWCD